MGKIKKNSRILGGGLRPALRRIPLVGCRAVVSRAVPWFGLYVYGDYIQIYTNGKPKLYNLVRSDRSPRQGGGLGVGPICKRGFAARIPTDRDATPLANLIRCKMIYSYHIYIGMAVVSEKKRFFLKKVNKLFASSDFVATFASAFEKNAPSYSDEEFSMREFELKKEGGSLENARFS